MIYLYKNQTNLVALTLDENATSVSYDVLFKFECEMDNKIKYFTASEIQNATRTNDFYIIESSTENYYQGTVNLTSGHWTYTVYEMPVSSPKSLDVDDAVKTLKEGRVTVYGDDDRDIFSENEDRNNVTFD